MTKKVDLNDKLVLINTNEKIFYGYFGSIASENIAKRFKAALDHIDRLSDFHYENTREVCIIS